MKNGPSRARTTRCGGRGQQLPPQLHELPLWHPHPQLEPQLHPLIAGGVVGKYMAFPPQETWFPRPPRRLPSPGGRGVPARPPRSGVPARRGVPTPRRTPRPSAGDGTPPRVRPAGPCDLGGTPGGPDRGRPGGREAACHSVEPNPVDGHDRNHRVENGHRRYRRRPRGRQRRGRCDRGPRRPLRGVAPCRRASPVRRRRRAGRGSPRRRRRGRGRAPRRTGRVPHPPGAGPSPGRGARGAPARPPAAAGRRR